MKLGGASYLVLPDLLRPGLKVVICGTAAGHRSARVGAYYAGRGNQFWDVLQRVGLTPVWLRPVLFRELLEYDIGLSDLVKGASGQDRDISDTDYDVLGFRAKMVQFAPRYVAFNGKKAAKVFLDQRHVDYGLLATKVGASFLYVLPSTSGAARRYWDERFWRDLAQRCASL